MERLAFAEPCVSLQQAAIQQDIVVDLKCGQPYLQENPVDPQYRAEFVSALTVAQHSGVTPYWLGKDVTVAGVRAELSESVEADVGSFSLSYYNPDRAEGDPFILLDVTTFPKAGDGPAQFRDRWASDPLVTRTFEPITVGGWTAEVASFGDESRPVNSRALLVDVGDMIVTVETFSGSTGVPGTDVNPLLDTALLVDVVENNLRRYSAEQPPASRLRPPSPAGV